MMTFSPEKLAKWSEGQWHNSSLLNVPLTGFCIDTRKIEDGDVFIAISTERRDGHDFLNSACQNGAVAAVVERFIPDVAIPQLVVNNSVDAFLAIAHGHRMEFPGIVIGITGSCGKTSTKDTLALLLGENLTCKTHANLNNQLGLSLTLLKLDPSIHKYAVVEVGISEAGEMGQLANTLVPDIAILTVVGSAHTEGIGGLEHVATEKAKLLRAVRNEGIALFPSECLQYEAFRKPLDNPLILYEIRDEKFSKNMLAFYWEFVPNAPDKGQLTVRNELIGKQRFDLPDAAVGQGTVRNIAMSLGISLSVGVEPEVLQKRILKWAPSPMRGELRSFGEQTFYVDCYNANPVSMNEAIQTFTTRFQEQPKLFVLGSMNELGDVALEQHIKIGKTLQLAPEDRAVLIGHHAEAYRQGMIEAGIEDSIITIASDLDEALPIVQAFQGAILLKGSRSYGLERILEKAAADIDEKNEERRLATAC